MLEVLKVSGPAGLVERGLEAIETTINKYFLYRDDARLEGGSTRYLFDGLVLVSLDDHNNPDNSIEADKQATFALILTWSSRGGRTQFQDPAVPDLTLTHPMRPYYPSGSWQEHMERPLQVLVEQGATVSSWNYHKADTVTDKKGLMMIGKGASVW